MTLSEKIAAQVALLPPEMAQLLQQHLAAGNKLVDVEIGRGPEAGQVALVMDHPFRLTPEALPEGVKYREIKNRDPQLFEYYTSDGNWSLLTAKFKPMVFQPVHGPPDPMPAHLEHMRKHRMEEEAAAKKRAEKNHEPPAPQPNPLVGDAANRFLGSMKMNFDMWHDGTGYDLEALDQVPEKELKIIESVLINHHPVDWRDIEALARIESPAARAAVVAALKSSNGKVRREAMHHAANESDPADREKLLLKALQSDDVFGGLSEAIDEAAEFHPPAVVEVLLRGALNRQGTTAVHFAALLYYIHGKAAEPFDWSHRPFFLRFDTNSRAERKAVFRELCETIGVDPAKFRSSL